MTQANTADSAHTVRPGRYQHFKGGVYLVVGEARHTESEETLVLYRAIEDGLAGDEVFARPAAMFRDQVTVGEHSVARFAYLGRLPG